ncbi:MAG: response regulator transcription factor [Armatimonadota bacterium]|nr:response regulator transcription factor [Armatimonadota bacterium]
MQRVLIVEDETSLAETLAVNLKAEGYRTMTASDGPSALDLAAAERPDLIILDIMLPGMDGLAVCRAIRKSSEVPIIMLTAKGREVDKVIGLEVGADDYVTKPFGMLELIARVRAALRRSAGGAAKQDVMEAGGVTLDRERHSVMIDGSPVDLRPREFGLLAALMENKGKPMSREKLLQRVWGEDEYIDQNTVDVHVRRLREKIEKDPGKPERIVTIRGAGYKFQGRE